MLYNFNILDNAEKHVLLMQIIMLNAGWFPLSVIVFHTVPVEKKRKPESNHEHRFFTCLNVFCKAKSQHFYLADMHSFQTNLIYYFLTIVQFGVLAVTN